MTIEQLLNCKAEELEVMSNEQLSAYFKPYLKWTHIEHVEKPTQKKNVTSISQAVKQKRTESRVQEILALYGKVNH